MFRDPSLCSPVTATLSLPDSAQINQYVGDETPRRSCQLLRASWEYSVSDRLKRRVESGRRVGPLGVRTPVPVGRPRRRQGLAWPRNEVLQARLPHGLLWLDQAGWLQAIPILGWLVPNRVRRSHDLNRNCGCDQSLGLRLAIQNVAGDPRQGVRSEGRTRRWALGIRQSICDAAASAAVRRGDLTGPREPLSARPVVWSKFIERRLRDSESTIWIHVPKDGVVASTLDLVGRLWFVLVAMTAVRLPVQGGHSRSNGENVMIRAK